MPWFVGDDLYDSSGVNYLSWMEKGIGHMRPNAINIVSR